MYTISPPAGDPQVGVFLGWYWYVGQLFVVFDFSTPISGDFELFPLYEGQLEDQIAKITYNSNGGVGDVTDPSDYVVGVEATVKRSVGISSPGYVFIGWNTQHDGTGTAYQPGELITVPEGGVVLYAQWGHEPRQPR